MRNVYIPLWNMIKHRGFNCLKYMLVYPIHPFHGHTLSSYHPLWTRPWLIGRLSRKPALRLLMECHGLSQGHPHKVAAYPHFSMVYNSRRCSRVWFLRCCHSSCFQETSFIPTGSHWLLTHQFGCLNMWVVSSPGIGPTLLQQAQPGWASGC